MSIDSGWQTTGVPRKKGALSTSDMKFIEENCSKMNLQDIADQLNRNIEPIKKYMANKNLTSFDVDLKDADRVRLRNVLAKKYYYKGILAQLVQSPTCDETEIFVNKWIDLMIQFKEDVLASEEQQITELILLNINLERIRRTEVKNITKIADLEDRIEKEYNRDASVRDTAALMRWETELQMCRASSSSYTSQIKTINHDIQVLNRDLKSTRDQRFNKIDSGDKTFLGILRRIQDDVIRSQLERQGELMRLATEKKRAELESYHTFADGQVDIPILNHKSAQKLIEDNKANER